MSTDAGSGTDSGRAPDANPEPVASGSPEFVVSLLREALRLAADACPESFGQRDLLDGIADLESVGNAVKAMQADWTVVFARGHVAQQFDAGVTDPGKLERSVAGEISLACHVSPTESRRRVRAARDLHDGLDHLRLLFGAGRISAYKVSTVVAATSHLDAAERAEVDRLLAAHDLDRLGVGRLRDRTRRLAAQVAPEKFLARCTAARSGRRVTLRPAADGMTDLTAHLPAEQGAACYTALQKAFNAVSVDPAPLTRGRGQVMADTLVERVTGHAVATDVDIQVQVVVPVETLIDPHSPLPAEIPGHGPVPADLLATTTGRKAWRKLVTGKGVVIGGDSTQRKFTGFLADLIRARDRYRCSELYCDAPIREVDHISRWADGGVTEFANGRGYCTLHNQLREQPGWRAERTSDSVTTTTPTGRTYVNPINRREP